MGTNTQGFFLSTLLVSEISPQTHLCGTELAEAGNFSVFISICGEVKLLQTISSPEGSINLAYLWVFNLTLVNSTTDRNLYFWLEPFYSKKKK